MSSYANADNVLVPSESLSIRTNPVLSGCRGRLVLRLEVE